MTPNSSTRVTVAVIDDQQDALRSVTCPLCHTPRTLTRSEIDAGGTWRCVRCSQHWDAARLTAVDAYAAWTVEREAVAHGAR
jgi:hypothetical protein